MTMLVVGSLYHFVLGILVTFFVFFIGGSVYSMFSGKGRDGRFTIIYSYTIGLFLFTFIAWLMLCGGGYLAAGIVLFLVSMLGVRRFISDIAGHLKGLPRVLLLFGPFVFMMALSFSLAYHGPSSELYASVYGDTQWYISEIMRMRSFPRLPHNDMLVHGFRVWSYSGMTPITIGALLSYLPMFDEMQFMNATLNTIYVLSFIICLFFLSGRFRCTGYGFADVLMLLGLSFLMLVIPQHPSLLVESIRIPLAIPLVFSAVALSLEDDMSVLKLIVMSIIVLVMTFFTKIFFFATLSVYLFINFIIMSIKRIGAGKTAVIAALGLLTGIGFIVIMMVHMDFITDSNILNPRYMPASLDVFLNANDTRLAIELFFQDIGVLILVTLLFVSGRSAVAISLLAGLVCYWLWGPRLLIAIGAGVALVCVNIFARPMRGLKNYLFVLSAFFLLLSGAIGEEVQEFRNFLIFNSFIALSVMMFLVVSGVQKRISRIFTYAVAGFTVLIVLLSVHLAYKPHPFLNKVYNQGFLYPEDYDIWMKVKTVTEPDALVFTDITGRDKGRRAGYYGYPGKAGRQLYIAGWFDRRIFYVPGALTKRLDLNEMFLDGRISISELELGREYAAYYAVVKNSHEMPDNFELLYKNRRFSLFRIRRKS